MDDRAGAQVSAPSLARPARLTQPAAHRRDTVHIVQIEPLQHDALHARVLKSAQLIHYLRGVPTATPRPRNAVAVCPL